MLLSNLNLLAQAPNGVARLRELILTLAVQGKLLPQDPQDEPASELLKKIRAEKDRLIAEGKIKRDKPLAEIAEEEKPFELPRGWNWVRLGQMTEIKGGKRLPAGHTFADGKTPYAYIQVTNMKAGTVATEHLKYLKPETQAVIRNYTISDADLYITIAGTIGQVGEVPAECHLMNLTENAAKIVFRFLNKRWLREVLNSSICQSQFVEKTVQQAQPKLALHRIADSLVPLPPLAEQSRIVTRVEELMRLCDALEAKGQLAATQHAQLVSTLLATLTESETPAQLAENWHRIATHFDQLLDRPEAVDALEQTILQLAVRGLLVPQDPQDEPASELLKKIRAEKDKLIAEGKIKRDKPLPPIAEDEQPFALPLGWEWVRLGNVSKVISGYAFSSEDFSAESGIRAIKITNAGVGEFHETDDYLPSSFKTGFENFMAAKHDLILALTRPYVSNGLKISRCPTSYEGALINQRVAAIRCSSIIVHEFAFAYVQSADVLSIYQNRFNGSGLQPNLKVSDVTELAFPLPPLAEQSRIVTRVAQLRRLCADLRQRLTASQSTQANLAEALVQAQAA